MTLAVIATALWLWVGAWSFVYWWTKTETYTREQFGLMMACSIFGPVTYVIGLIIDKQTK